LNHGVAPVSKKENPTGINTDQDKMPCLPGKKGTRVTIQSPKGWLNSSRSRVRPCRSSLSRVSTLCGWQIVHPVVAVARPALLVDLAFGPIYIFPPSQHGIFYLMSVSNLKEIVGIQTPTT
jgi:hypothetical protein